MPKISLNQRDLERPDGKQAFGELVSRLQSEHPGIREQALLFSFEARQSVKPEKTTGTAAYCASMVGEGKFGTLHLVYELLGRPDLSQSGFVSRDLAPSEVESLLGAFHPFLAESAQHPNVAFLLAARESGALVRVSMLANADERLKADASYRAFRTNLLFTLFNEGALRGSDGAARQAILDSFSYLPNYLLSAEGQFLDPDSYPAESGAVSFVRAGVDSSSGSIGGIDKFPSLMAVCAKRLRADGNRIVPGVMIRDGVHVGKRNIFMFHAAVNIAAFIGDDNLIDSHASIASAAQLGNKNKIGSFVSLEGVLSPANATPVIIGDENFIGTFSRIGTGIVIGNRNFIGAGVHLSKGTKLKDCRKNSETYGQYLNAQDLNGAFNEIALAPNNAFREFNGVELTPGEIVLFENTAEFMSRFEGDERIKAKPVAKPA